MLQLEKTDTLFEMYDRYRDVARGLHTILSRHATRAVIQDAADRLGLLQDGIIVFDSEAEVAVLSDFLYMGCVRGQRTIAERALTKKWPPEGSIQRTVLRAMVHARYVLAETLEAQPGTGIRVKDWVRGDELFIMDRRFSRTARRGTMLSGRVLEFPEMNMFTGASLPVPPEAEDRFLRATEAMRQAAGDGAGRLPRENELMLAEVLTVALLFAGAAEDVAYEDSGEGWD